MNIRLFILFAPIAILLVVLVAYYNKFLPLYTEEDDVDIQIKDELDMQIEEKNITAQLPQNEPLHIQVLPINDFSLAIDLTNPRETLFKLSSKYSNANDYAIELKPDIFFEASNNTHPFSKQKLKGIEGDYLVQFPIYWDRNKPYAALSKQSGIAESMFLFPRAEKSQYTIEFVNFPMPIYNSILGEGRKFSFSDDELFDSYFIFGNKTQRCEMEYGNFSLKIFSTPGFFWEDTFCSEAASIFDYYYSAFGKPQRLRNDYILTFSNASQFNAMASGMFNNKFDREHLAHELFHMWQPGQDSCSSFIFYHEGLPTFMQYYSQYRSNLINESELNKKFTGIKNDLQKVENLQELYFKENNELLELREKNPKLHYLLIYKKGALLWSIIQEEENDVEMLFDQHLRGDNCLRISQLLSEAEEKLYERLMEK